MDLEKRLPGSCIPASLINQIIQALSKLDQQFKSILAEHLVTNKVRLSHFTDLAALESILPVEKDGAVIKTGRNVLRQYHVDYMNDPTEGKRLLSFQKIPPTGAQNKIAQEVSERLDAIFAEYYFQPTQNCDDCTKLMPSVFITSLTHESDRLDLWRAYGRDGSGYCLNFEIDAQEDGMRQHFREQLSVQNAFRKSDENPSPAEDSNTINKSPPVLYAIRYDDKQISKTLKELAAPLRAVDKAADKVTDASVKTDIYRCVAAILLELLYLYKDEQYSTEKEVRAIRVTGIDDARVKSDERTPGRLYVETNPFLFTTSTNIIIGPKAKDTQAALWNLRWRLNKLGHADKVCVRESEVKYR